MSDEVLEWKPRGRPVRWAVGIVAAIAGLSGLSIWLGLANPRVTARLASSDGDGELGSPVSIRLELVNQAETMVEVIAAGESLPGLEFDGFEMSDPAAQIDGGGHAWLRLTYRITDCTAIAGEGPEVPVTYRTALGVVRTREHDLNVGADGGSWIMQLIQWQCDIELGGELAEG